MVSSNSKIQINVFHDLSRDLINQEIVSSSIGPKNEICVLTVNEIPKRIDDMFPQTKTTHSFDYNVYIVHYENVNKYQIKNQLWNYSFVQPIEDDKILLACGRSKYYSKDNFDLNGKIFDMNGKLIREILLGDGIQDLAVTSNNIIWTSYFDEGVFGNYGWVDPIGSCGLRAWDSEGHKEYVYDGIDEHSICDCYALNVVNDKEVWFYYYTEFELARLKNSVITYFKPNISGSDGFIIFDKYVLFRGGYDNRDEYFLFEIIRNGKMEKKKKYQFLDENGKKINADLVNCRGSLMMLLTESKIYLVDLREIVQKGI